MLSCEYVLLLIIVTCKAETPGMVILKGDFESFRGCGQENSENASGRSLVWTVWGCKRTANGFAEEQGATAAKSLTRSAQQVKSHHPEGLNVHNSHGVAVLPFWGCCFGPWFLCIESLSSSFQICSGNTSPRAANTLYASWAATVCQC